ncbi:hypothetical protein CLAFUW4_00422 [Fulvia fulva]|uniref:Rrn9 domain-containing protein n=1 Tax=Passalora fulva TaxID=5499 RepID=A0A9Q8L6Y0_PASFU|nr:uncharacterized protein CLAFUR5_00424 [Fulvia fulva]KAK4636216.1 hypothetical protein CLAFUR4_00422 [Fulvia fulva]KAK4637090.1 hypothetical protein CLAFUR0_00423 [Fulvia fulva]UJO11906.1 hypothetical protein CLAFUR5_00424 [Fulvia fulva]WPV09687.1 hypothetical protein CLAFUW4_00422 [Fulvia fulva]WPV23527.1 hypothetical protein CLAFUW7_00426 [Fulvia fulva]
MSSIDADFDRADEHTHDDLESEEEPDREESHADDDLSDDDRPGRFYGPDSSWRFYTQKERALAASLDQAENNDLSIHLYNAHAWKQQQRDEQRMVEARPWHSKQQWIKPDEEGKLPFLPPQAWTAWPLRPEHVPRSTEQWGVPATAADEDADTLRAPESWKPSLHLQEEVKATILRLAKERFHAREWAHAHQTEFVKAEPTKRPMRSTSIKPEYDSDEPLDDLDRLEKELQQEAPPDPGESSEHYTPMVLDDEDAASRIVQPSVRHILGKLDNLFIALHKSRRGHRKEPGGSGRRSRSSRSQSQARARPQSSGNAARKRKRVVSDPHQQGNDGEVEIKFSSDDGEEGEKVSHGSSSKSALGTRDWSEILGVAALVGFDQTVIDRTARRCATLFREGMTLRTMPEVLAGTAHDHTTDYIPDMVPPIASESDEDEPDEPMGDTIHVYACPDVDCARHDRPFEQRWRLSEHLKRKHGHTDEELATETLKLSPSARTSPSNDSDGDNDSSASAEFDSGERGPILNGSSDGRDEFLKPISVHIGRSRDKRARKARSRSSGPNSRTGRRNSIVDMKGE